MVLVYLNNIGWSPIKGVNLGSSPSQWELVNVPSLGRQGILPTLEWQGTNCFSPPVVFNGYTKRSVELALHI